MNAAPLAEIESPPATGKTVLHLPLGLLGFEKFKQYAVLARPEEAPFLWLQMLESPDRAFLVVPASALGFAYRPEISAEDVEFLRVRNADEALVLNVVTLHADGRATVNLKGPIVLNRQRLLGKQIVPANAADFSVCHPLPVADRTDDAPC
jgi:flagellar assembly factor FliW